MKGGKTTDKKAVGDKGFQVMRIVPADQSLSGPSLTRGTKVFCGDTEISGIYRIELVADVNDVWRAVIFCHVAPPELSCSAEVRRDPSRVMEVDITSLSSQSSEYALVMRPRKPLWQRIKDVFIAP